MKSEDYSRVAQCAVREIQEKTLGTTQQILDVHAVEYENGSPKILEIESDASNARVYFPIIGEAFYFVVCVSLFPEISVCATNTEPNVNVYLRATSPTMTFSEICGLTDLTPTGGWSLGDKTASGKSLRKYSSVRFEPSPGPGRFQGKLESLLDVLERDANGVRNLAADANAYIQVVMEFHNGNTMLGGPAIDKLSLRRLADLSLDIDFDMYAAGNFFKEG